MPFRLKASYFCKHTMNFLSEKSGDKNDMFANDGLVKGVCDIHLHCRPDSRERSVDEYGFMQNAMRAGYRHLTLHTTTNVKVGKGKVFPCWLITDRHCPKSSV